MENFDISDYDFCDLNIRDPEFTYIGELYHYTNEAGYKGIFSPMDSKGNPIPLLENCIALRFTKIDCMNRNDNSERRYVQEMVELVISDLLQKAEIPTSFANVVRTFQPTDVGFNSVITDRIHEELGNRIIRWGFDKLDYYIACFSTNPNNKYIKESFNCPICISFLSAFSNPSEVLCKQLYMDGPIMNFANYYCDLPPYSNISQCFLNDHTPKKVRKVLYDKSKKYAVIKKYLIDIYRKVAQDGYIERQRDYISEQLEEMYSIYDSIFKSSEGDYYKEEEVRFVLPVRRNEKHRVLRQYGFVPDSEIKNGVKVEYLYVPVSKLFLAGGDNHA